MSEREWSIELARAKLLRIAADFITDGYLEHEAQTLINEAMGVNHGRGFADEQGFRGILSAVLSWGDEEIAPAVAEVYGEAVKDEPAALIKAIRAITSCTPRQEVEAMRARLDKAIHDLVASDRPREDLGVLLTKAVFMAADRLDERLVSRKDALRVAAEAFFGGDFGATCEPDLLDPATPETAVEEQARALGLDPGGLLRRGKEFVRDLMSRLGAA